MDMNLSKLWVLMKDREAWCAAVWGRKESDITQQLKQEMARVNIKILGISELKWTGMGEFNSDDHYTYYCGQDSLRRNGVALIVNRSPKCSIWVQSQK